RTLDQHRAPQQFELRAYGPRVRRRLPLQLLSTRRPRHRQGDAAFSCLELAAMTTRRVFIAGAGAGSFGLLSGCASAIAAPAAARREGELTSAGLEWSHLEWRRGFEGQRRADLGNGRYLNPIFSGDRPDPSIIKDGDTYYMTFSSFDAYPGLLIWASHDLVNWRPLQAA